MDYSTPRVTMITGVLQFDIKIHGSEWGKVYKHAREYIRTSTQRLSPKAIEGALTRKKTRVIFDTPMKIGESRVTTELHPFKYKNGHGTVVSNFSNAVDFKYTTNTGRRGIKVYGNGRIQVSGFKSTEEILCSSKELMRQMIQHFREGPNHEEDTEGMDEIADEVNEFLQTLPPDLNLDVSDLENVEGTSTSGGDDMGIHVTSCQTVLYNAMWRLCPPGSSERLNFNAIIAYCSIDTMEFKAYYNAERCAPRMTLEHQTYHYKLVLSVKGSVMYTHKDGAHIESAAALLQQIVQRVNAFS